MSDENTGPTVEERARAQGWRPKEDFKGADDQFVDAETFIKRGEEVLPFVKANNRRLQETVEQQNNRLVELERQNRANAAALEAVQESQREVTAERAEQTVEQIEAEIIQARANDDVQTELTLMRKYTAAVTAAAKAKEKPLVTQEQRAVNVEKKANQSPEFQAFLRANPWWSDDPVMRAASIEVQNELVREGKVTAATPMTDRLDMVAEVTLAKFGKKDNGRRGSATRVEGGGGASNSGSSSGASGKSFSDLPEDAKTACEKAGKRLKIGANEKYKTLDDWKKEYTRIYFAS